jgi:D-amino-acid dehydrogenase
MAEQKRIAIIGGGIIGLSAAYFLQADGHEVTILEKDDIGAGSSRHNAGLVVPSHFVPLAAPGMVRLALRWMFNPESPLYVKPRLDVDLMTWLWHFAASCTRKKATRAMPLLRDLSLASYGLYEEMSDRGGLKFGLEKKGLLMLFRTEHGKRGTVGTAATAASIGVDARVLNKAGLQELEPHVTYRATGGVYYPGDAHLVPAAFLECLRDLLLERGVNILTSRSVVGFETRPALISGVRTSDGMVKADEYVLAGGAWSPEIIRDLRLRFPMQAGKGYSITVPATREGPRIPCLLEEARVAVTPMGDQIRFAGTMELTGMTSDINLRRVHALLRAVPKYFENLHPSVEHASTVWSGLRPCTPDGLPYIGRFRGFDNLIAATGHAMIGVSLAPITGRLVAEIVNQKIPSVDLLLMRPDRYA